MSETKCSKCKNPFKPILKPCGNLYKTCDNCRDKSKNCSEEGCKTIPNYNYEGEKTALYCSKHKLDNMIDIKNKKCQEKGCKIQSYYLFYVLNNIKLFFHLHNYNMVEFYNLFLDIFYF